MTGPSVPLSFEEVLQAQQRILYKVAYIYCRNPEDRRDLIQEMALQLWRAYGRFDGRAALSTWAYRVALNVAISYRRHEGRRIRDTLPIELAFDVAGADAEFEAGASLSGALGELVAGLDEMNRALVLLHLEGFDHSEIAGMLGTSASNVGTRMNRIRQALKADHAAAHRMD